MVNVHRKNAQIDIKEDWRDFTAVCVYVLEAAWLRHSGIIQACLSLCTACWQQQLLYSPRNKWDAAVTTDTTKGIRKDIRGHGVKPAYSISNLRHTCSQHKANWSTKGDLPQTRTWKRRAVELGQVVYIWHECLCFYNNKRMPLCTMGCRLSYTKHVIPLLHCVVIYTDTIKLPQHYYL